MTAHKAAQVGPVFQVVSRRYGDTGPPRDMLQIKCQSCSRREAKPLRPDFPPAAVARFFRGKGWLVDDKGRDAKCPKCQETKVTDLSKETLRRQRQMHRLLEDHFDEEAGRYRGDWSDAKIAQETGLSPAAVSKARDAGYGELREDPELAALRQEWAEVRERAARDMAAMRDMTEEALGKLQNRLNQIDARIADLLRKKAA